MGPRQRAYRAFLASEGATAEPTAGQRRSVRARAVQPVPQPAGPRPNDRQLAKRGLVVARVEQRYAAETARNGLEPGGSTFEEKTASAILRAAFTDHAVVDLLVDVEDQIERQDKELAEARQVITALEARLARLEDVERADTKAARAIARLKGARE